MIVFLQVSARRYYALAVRPAVAWRAGSLSDAHAGLGEGMAYTNAEIIAGPDTWSSVERAAFVYAKAHGWTLSHEAFDQHTKRRAEAVTE